MKTLIAACLTRRKSLLLCMAFCRAMLLIPVSVMPGSVQPSDVIIYDPLNGSTVGTLVSNPPPALVFGAFSQGAQPLRESVSPAIRYSCPAASVAKICNREES
jgi:hypothetical protein